MTRPRWVCLSALAALLAAQGTTSLADDGSAASASSQSIRMSQGMRVVAIRMPSKPAGSFTSDTDLATPILPADEGGQTTLLSTPYPRPPLAGFSPLVAITTSNKRRPGTDAFEHILEYSYQGSPLNGPANENFVVGIFDSGSSADIVFEPFDVMLGLVDGYLTDKVVELGGVGGSADAYMTEPVGFFMAGLSKIDQATGLLDLTQVVGHSNNSMLVAPEINCGEAGGLTAIVSTSLLSFFNTIIRADTPVRRTVGGDEVLSPDLQILQQGTPLPVYPRKIAMTFGSLDFATTSSYLWLDLLGDVIYAPTMLASSSFAFPTGGAFFSTIGAIEGEPSPINPLQFMRVLVDTGSQSSIMTPAMAANLNLNTANPDFTIDACGVGGLVTGIPGFFVDYIRMNTSGGPLEFSQAPFVILDITSPDGEPLDGILGMNFFWNRNVIFEPSLSASGFLHVSDPIPFAYADIDRDLDVDEDDVAAFSACFSGENVPLRADCTLVDADEDGDVDCDDWAMFVSDWPAQETCPAPLALCDDDCNLNDVSDACEAFRGQLVDSDGNGVYDACESAAPPAIVSAVSRKLQGAVEFDIPLLPTVGVGTECRAGGPTMVVVSFSEEIKAIDGAPDANEVSLSAGTVGSVSISGSQMEVNLSGVSDMTCLVITLAGLSDLAGNPLTGDNTLRVRVLLGDTNDTGSVSVADVNQTRSRSGQTVDANNFRSDTNCSGSISVADVNQVRSRSGNSVTCP